MKDRPDCKCHDWPMTKQGQGWRCTVKHRARERRYYAENLQKERERNRERLYVGSTYHGRIKDSARREAIRRYAYDRVYDFKSKQAADYADFNAQLTAEAQTTDNASLLAAFRSSVLTRSVSP